jgi:hypothetical protein
VKDLLKGLVGAITGGVPGIVTGLIDKHLTGMDPEKRAAIERDAVAASRAHEAHLVQLATEAQVAFNQRIADMEGTAKDLKGLPIIGPLILGVRGMLRPIGILFTFWLDYKVFSGAWGTAPDGTPILTSEVFWLINLLVLGFLFGERALINLMPFLTRFRAAKNGGNGS